jgi:ABC-type multidrug transport system fused ATPase/permease subunit
MQNNQKYDDKYYLWLVLTVLSFSWILIVSIPLFIILFILFQINLEPIFAKNNLQTFSFILRFILTFILTLIYFISPFYLGIRGFVETKKLRAKNYDKQIKLGHEFEPKIKLNEVNSDLRNQSLEHSIQGLESVVPKNSPKYSQNSLKRKRFLVRIRYPYTIFSFGLIFLVVFLMATIFRYKPIVTWLFLFIFCHTIFWALIWFNAFKAQQNLKHWAFNNLLKLPKISSIYYLNEFQNLKNYLIIKQFGHNLHFSYEPFVDDYLSLIYKDKKLEILNLVYKSPKSTSQSYTPFKSYLCICFDTKTKNTAKTIVWTNPKFKFDLPHKIITESTLFNQKFQVLSTSQLEARMHLKTHIMERMLNLENKFVNKNYFFYFYENKIFVIFETKKDALEPVFDNETWQYNLDQKTLDEINLCLQIFNEIIKSQNF